MKLELKHIKKSFGEKAVLKDCSAVFEKGKIYGLLGRNGAGKTTLFNCISKEQPMDEGHVLIEEEGSIREINELDIGYAYATPILPEFLTGYEYLKYFMEINQERIDPNKSIEDYFDLMRIEEEDRYRLMKGYSHGMKNKMQMLCFIIAHPDVILLDEPLTSFDVVVALEMKQLLKDMKEDHILIFSTHILQLAMDLCDEIYVLHQGKLELIDHEMLKSSDFEERIVEMLSDEDAM